MYTVQFFIDKFEKIPEENWCVGSYTNIQGGHCALGHCLHTLKEGYSDLLVLFHSNDLNAAYINDDSDKRYQQPTPKQRILAALYDIKKSQQPLYEDITKELAIFPVEEKADQPVKEIV